MWKEFFIQIFNPNKIALHKLGKWLIDGSVYFLLYSMSSVSFVKLPVNNKKIILLLNTNLSRNKTTLPWTIEKRKEEWKKAQKKKKRQKEMKILWISLVSRVSLHYTRLRMHQREPRRPKSWRISISDHSRIPRKPLGPRGRRERFQPSRASTRSHASPEGGL